MKKDLDAKGITVFDKVPAVKGLNFVLFQSKSLTKVQRLTKLLNDLAIVLPIATLVCFAGVVVLTRPRRRGVVRAATALAFSMTLILVFLALARNHYLSGLSPSQSVAANAAVIDTVTAVLRRGIRIILIASLVLAVIAMIVGNDRVAPLGQARNAKVDDGWTIPRMRGAVPQRVAVGGPRAWRLGSGDLE